MLQHIKDEDDKAHNSYKKVKGVNSYSTPQTSSKGCNKVVCKVESCRRDFDSELSMRQHISEMKDEDHRLYFESMYSDIKDRIIKSFEEAREWLDITIESPYIVKDRKGEIHLEWWNDSRYLEVVIRKDFSVVYMQHLYTTEEKVTGIYASPDNSTQPRRLLRWLGKKTYEIGKCEFGGCSDRTNHVYYLEKNGEYRYLCERHVKEARKRGFNWVRTNFLEKPTGKILINISNIREDEHTERKPPKWDGPYHRPPGWYGRRCGINKDIVKDCHRL